MTTRNEQNAQRCLLPPGETPTPNPYIETAKRLYEEEGEIEIDTRPGCLSHVSEPSGCWVKAWVWVSDEDTEE